MSFHPFAFVMIATFLAAAATMLAGVTGMGGQDTAKRLARSNLLMGLRVGLCALLFGEILLYALVLK